MSTAKRFAASYSTTDINKSGARVYDEAWARGGVEIRRHSQRFALIRQDVLDQMIADAGDKRPRSLADLLNDYDADKIKGLTGDFLAAPSRGKELI
ncbi:MAG: hypothetical protein HQL45_01275 [Alphaproteobacteria bacterium]|nr:hypothetical protein [Alphaproteobacteria bacterium]MBF0355447.1 hypothetical protein [Alphaproteobacteria bacterium]